MALLESKGDGDVKVVPEKLASIGAIGGFITQKAQVMAGWEDLAEEEAPVEREATKCQAVAEGMVVSAGAAAAAVLGVTGEPGSIGEVVA